MKLKGSEAESRTLVEEPRARLRRPGFSRARALRAQDYELDQVASHCAAAGIADRLPYAQPPRSGDAGLCDPARGAWTLQERAGGLAGPSSADFGLPGGRLRTFSALENSSALARECGYEAAFSFHTGVNRLRERLWTASG